MPTESFRMTEQGRQIALKPELYSQTACQPGIYRNKPNPICLHKSGELENLHETFREVAAKYFRDRCIKWHSPGHLTSSQVSCINLTFAFIQRPDLLKGMLKALGYPVEKVLPFELDQLSRLNEVGWTLHSEADLLSLALPHYIAYEWIGARNYLCEQVRKKVADDSGRTRGENFSSVDFAVRFLRSDGKSQIVLVEWKYLETAKTSSLRFRKKSGTDRLGIYKAALEHKECPIRLPSSLKFEDLFYDPFDQMMRHQLLASAMEREHEMGADIVSYLHIAPKANTELVNRITSPKLRGLGKSIYEVWQKLVVPDRFQHCFLEDFVSAAVSNAPDEDWAQFVTRRYDGMVASVEASEVGK